jgi:F-type H+-transporting ATPase subunit delta
MLELVRGYATAAFDAARRVGRLEQTAADLVGISHLLLHSEALRLALTDGSIPAPARVAVLRELLGSKVAPEALGPVLYSIENERAAELPKSVEQLIEGAELARAREVAGQPVGAESPVGRSGAYERIRGFADRTFELIASPREVDSIEDELFRLARIAESTPSLREVVADTGVPIESRLSVLEDLLSSKVKPETLRLATYTIRAGRARDLTGALDYLVELAAADRGRRIADVRAAVELTASERSELSTALSALTHRAVELRTRIDPAVLGGLSVAVGDIVIDGTVRHRLEQLRESLANNN